MHKTFLHKKKKNKTKQYVQKPLSPVKASKIKKEVTEIKYYDH